MSSLTSVVIPAHNAAAFLAEAIESVLRQTAPVELIVVDDGSTDHSAEIAQSYGAAVQCIRQERRGLGAARNRGVRAASHGRLAFLDADDIWPSDKLERQCEVLAARPDIDMVFGLCAEFAAPEGGRWTSRSASMPGYVAGAMLARRALFDRVGGFSENGKVGEFIDWYARACEAGARAILLDHVVLHRRVHGSNMTAKANRAEYLEVIQVLLQRRRKAP